MATRRTYRLQCPVCGERFEDDGLALDCVNDHEPGLLLTEYRRAEFEPGGGRGLSRYKDWLPVARELREAGGTVTYQSRKLARAVGLERLWIAFNGFWPEMGAAMETGTFKELEAYTVLSRLPATTGGVLVVASAGNTAAAFAAVCSRNEMPCLIVVPESGLECMGLAGPLDPRVKTVCLRGNTDYYDAIALANRVARLDGFFPEGGVKNVGRRDGLGTVLLNAVESIGRLPDYYFQAVGSGSGGIAVFEAARRLVADGRFGATPPKLMLSQNHPFTPIYDAWRRGRREFEAPAAAAAKEQIRQIDASVLSNRQPPYSVRGGVFDVLTESGGEMLKADNAGSRAARELFEESEGVDIEPAAGVALATLIEAVNGGRVERDAVVLLNVTGGGRRRASRRAAGGFTATLDIAADESGDDEAVKKIVALFD